MFIRITKFLFVGFILCCSISQMNSILKKKIKGVRCRTLQEEVPCNQIKNCEYKDGKCQGKSNPKNDLSNVDLSGLYDTAENPTVKPKPKFLNFKKTKPAKNPNDNDHPVAISDPSRDDWFHPAKNPTAEPKFTAVKKDDEPQDLSGLFHPAENPQNKPKVLEVSASS